MSEQYPLLCDDFSDEDKFSPRFQRRRLMNLRGRANNHIKGAAAIMTRWPEHWTSILTYWWIGLGMIALTTFIIYNALFSIAVIQPTNTRPTKYDSFKTNIQTTKPAPPPSVLMHVFVNDEEEEDLNKYLPYIEVFANKYKDFTYNLIIVANDTNIKLSTLSDEINNNIALNSLWANDVNYGNLVSSYNNINVKHVTLTKYLNESPMKKHWKNLPHHFIPFLVRAISIWDKGGIALNPIILTPQSPHASYIEKFVSIIKQFKKSYTKNINKQDQNIPVKKHNKISPKFNNIQDIINALGRGESSDDPDKETLHSVESRNNLIVSNRDSKLMPFENQNMAEKQRNYLSTKKQHSDTFIDSNIVTESETLTHVKNTINEQDKINNSSSLPLFLEYLFHNKKLSPNTTNSVKSRRSPKVTEMAKIDEDSDIRMEYYWNSIKSTDSYKPMIVSAKGIPYDSATNYFAKPTNQDDETVFELTVDLKGNMIATETSCHAFIGNMFTNAMHHDMSESLTDFIIKELSIFCKGLLATCVGIDVILV